MQANDVSRTEKLGSNEQDATYRVNWIDSPFRSFSDENQEEAKEEETREDIEQATNNQKTLRNNNETVKTDDEDNDD